MDGRRFELLDVGVVRGDRALVEGLSATIPDHGITVIAGPSGSGKSTLLRLLNRLEVPSAGVVRQRGTPLDDLDPRALRRDVGMVFQRPVPLPGDVAENLRVARPDASDAELEDVLRRVGLDVALHRPADELSGGEGQRLAIARTLLTQPTMLLLDEPTSALDPAATLQIEALVASLADEGVASVWVTHDIEQLRRIAHQVLIVVGGRVVQQGHATDVLAAPTPEVAGFLRGEET